MKFEQDRIENSEKKFENTHLREVGFVCASGFSAQANSTSSFKEHCHGWERSEIGEEGEMGLSKNWVVFASVGLGDVPRGFLF